jgi:Domain of unknown function (DUF4381)
MRRPWTMALTAVCLLTGTAPLGPPALVQQQGNAAVAVLAGKGADGGLTVSLSGVVYLTLSVEGPPSLEVEPGQRVLASDVWKVRAAVPPATIPLGDGRVRWQQTFQLAPLDRGEQPLALAPLRYRAGREEAHTVTWRPIPITVTTAITRVDVGEARDITDIEQLPPVPPWWRAPLWAGLALLVLALAGGAWFLVRRWRRAAPALTPAQAALRELDRLAALQLPQAGRVERFHTLLSLILRRYFERRLQLPVRRQTTTEFLDALRRGPQLTPEQQQRVRDFLERCDLAKFAGVMPAPEACEAVVLLARTLVEQTANPPVPTANGTTSAAETGGIQA